MINTMKILNHPNAQCRLTKKADFRSRETLSCNKY